MPTHIPLSVLDKTAANALSTVLHFHFPLGSSILDPCCGGSIWWDPRTLSQYLVTRTDILPPFNLDLFEAAAKHPEWYEAFDGVVYDPPFLLGQKDSKDRRKEVYGGYHETKETLGKFREALNGPLLSFLKPGGKVIVKCQDQFTIEGRKLYLWHIEWVEALTQVFEITDFYVYRGHHLNPRSYQVKKRQCAIIIHSYLIVAQKPGESYLARAPRQTRSAYQRRFTV